MHRTLIHEPTYTQALSELGDIQRLDDALTGVEWALATNPEVYDIVKGTRARWITAAARVVPRRRRRTACPPRIRRGHRAGSVTTKRTVRYVYREGSDAAQSFERTMDNILRVSKEALAEREAAYQKSRANRDRPGPRPRHK
jgi:hypothetical protein